MLINVLTQIDAKNYFLGPPEKIAFLFEKIISQILIDLGGECHMDFLAFVKSDLNVFGSKKPCLKATLGFNKTQFSN